MEKNKKISVYLSEVETALVAKKAGQVHLSNSEYLRHKGLDHTIQSDLMKSAVASLTCQLYCLADTVEDELLRDELKDLGGKFYGAIKN